MLTYRCLVGVGGAMGDATTINLDDWDRDFGINVTSMVKMARVSNSLFLMCCLEQADIPLF